jgi:hypothetical protein
MEQLTSIVLTPSVGSPCLQGEPNPCLVPPAKRGNERAPLLGSSREAGGT